MDTEPEGVANMTVNSSSKWDRHAIKAEIHRRGKTLTRLSLDAGLDPSACRCALLRRQPRGERAIAAFLGVEPATLWPERYRDAQETARARKNSRGPSRNKHGSATGVAQ